MNKGTLLNSNISGLASRLFNIILCQIPKPVVNPLAGYAMKNNVSFQSCANASVDAACSNVNVKLKENTPNPIIKVTNSLNSKSDVILSSVKYSFYDLNQKNIYCLLVASES